MQRAGCTVVAVTVDISAGRNTSTATRARRLDTRTCGDCHQVNTAGNPTGGLAVKPMFAGVDVQGLEAQEDAALAVKHGADGIWVSNHGGRALESGRGTIESLPGVVKGAGGKVPVVIDGGARHGTDVFKALALGASAVGLGRPYACGLACFGQAGMERAILARSRLPRFRRVIGDLHAAVPASAGMPTFLPCYRRGSVRSGIHA